MNKAAKLLLEKLSGKEHVIWDWNGTLLDDVDHAVRTINFFLEEQALPTLDRSRYQKVFGFPIRDYYVRLGFDFEKESFESLCERFVDRFMAHAKDLPLASAAEPVLRELHRQGVKQSILSASDQASLDSLIEHYALAPLFSSVFGISDKMASSKIHRGQELMLLSGCAPEETVMVGDTLHDLEVARALGIDAVLVGHGHSCPVLLAEHHGHVVHLVDV